MTDNQRVQAIANTAAHEAGHTYGLRHVNNLGLNELMRVGALATNLQNGNTNYAFLDNTFFATEALLGILIPQLSNGNPIPQNSHQRLMENLGITTFLRGSDGTQVPLIAGDVVGGDPDSLGDGCCCSLCGGAAMTTSPADAQLQTEPPVFLHRIKPAEFVVFRAAAAGDGLVRAADLGRPGDAVYRVVGTLKAPAKETGQPLRLTGVFLRREHVEAGPELTAGLLRLDADPLNPGLKQQ